MKWKCEDCRFVEWPIGDGTVAECRRRAPMVFPGTAAMWPKVDLDDWCGEWQQTCYER